MLLMLKVMVPSLDIRIAIVMIVLMLMTATKFAITTFITTGWTCEGGPIAQASKRRGGTPCVCCCCCNICCH